MRTLAALALVVGSTLGIPQTVADALRQGVRPVAAADLPDRYRAVTLTSSEGSTTTFSSLFYMGVGMSGGVDRDQRSNLLLSLINVSFVDPEEFAELLDGKRPRIRSYTLDLSAALTRSSGSQEVPAPVFVESWIEAGRIQQWTPKPSITKAAILDAFRPPEPGSSADRDHTLANAKQVALGVIMYSGDFDDRLPMASSTAQAQEIVAPYLRNMGVWKTYNPKGGRLLYNTALSNVTSFVLPQPAETLLIYDEADWPDGGRAVGFADGHARFLSGEEWVRAWDAEMRRRERRKADALASKLKLPKPTRKAGPK